jgi:hypothetical protein
MAASVPTVKAQQAATDDAIKPAASMKTWTSMALVQALCQPRGRHKPYENRRNATGDTQARTLVSPPSHRHAHACCLRTRSTTSRSQVHLVHDPPSCVTRGSGSSPCYGPETFGTVRDFVAVFQKPCVRLLRQSCWGKTAHCNAANISERRFVLFPNGFGISIVQPASSEGLVSVTVLGFSRGGGAFCTRDGCPTPRYNSQAYPNPNPGLQVLGEYQT